jgi:hypothetical protein
MITRADAVLVKAFTIFLHPVTLNALFLLKDPASWE